MEKTEIEQVINDREIRKSDEEKVIEHLQWAFKGHQVGNFGHQIDGTATYGIYYSRFVWADQLEKMNQLGLKVHHIQFGSDDDTMIVVVSERKIVAR